MKYELIDPLKNLRFTLVPGIKELSLVILKITKLCLLYIYLDVMRCCRLFKYFIYLECHELWLFYYDFLLECVYTHTQSYFKFIVDTIVDFLDYCVGWGQHYLWILFSYFIHWNYHLIISVVFISRDKKLLSFKRLEDIVFLVTFILAWLVLQNKTLDAATFVIFLAFI